MREKLLQPLPAERRKGCDIKNVGTYTQGLRKPCCIHVFLHTSIKLLPGIRRAKKLNQWWLKHPAHDIPNMLNARARFMLNFFAAEPFASRDSAPSSLAACAIKSAVPANKPAVMHLTKTGLDVCRASYLPKSLRNIATGPFALYYVYFVCVPSNCDRISEAEEVDSNAYCMSHLACISFVVVWWYYRVV